MTLWETLRCFAEDKAPSLKARAAETPWTVGCLLPAGVLFIGLGNSSVVRLLAMCRTSMARKQCVKVAVRHADGLLQGSRTAKRVNGMKDFRIISADSCRWTSRRNKKTRMLHAKSLHYSPAPTSSEKPVAANWFHLVPILPRISHTVLFDACALTPSYSSVVHPCGSVDVELMEALSQKLQPEILQKSQTSSGSTPKLYVHM